MPDIRLTVDGSPLVVAAGRTTAEIFADAGIEAVVSPDPEVPVALKVALGLSLLLLYLGAALRPPRLDAEEDGTPA